MLKNLIYKDLAAYAPIRIWIVGCSTGEEVYSIAICLLEYLDSQTIKPPIQIYATDISGWAIEKARKGLLLKNKKPLIKICGQQMKKFFLATRSFKAATKN
jgi:two-component system, chemotaxis family, CheB/CheR fusion protein